jgi:hypothetical protein
MLKAYSYGTLLCVNVKDRNQFNSYTIKHCIQGNYVAPGVYIIEYFKFGNLGFIALKQRISEIKS